MKEDFHIECQPGVQIYPGLFLGGIPAQIYLLLNWYLPQQRSKSRVTQAVVCRHSTCWLVDPAAQCLQALCQGIPRVIEFHETQLIAQLLFDQSHGLVHILAIGCFHPPKYGGNF